MLRWTGDACDRVSRWRHADSSPCAEEEALMAVDPLVVAWKVVVVEEALALRAIVAHGAVAGGRCPIVTLGAVKQPRGSALT